MIQIPVTVLQSIIDKYGEEDQLLQTSGECGELIAVIQNYLRAKKFKYRTETLLDVIEEAVDVFFMVQQIRHMNPGLFDSMCNTKLTAVFRKIKNEG